MKKAIVTLAAGERYQAILNETKLFLKAYAKRIGADLVIETKKDESLSVPMYQKLSVIYNNLKKYDRVAWIDVDILISKAAPSIFDEVPEGKIGIFNEGLWTPREMAIEDWERLTGFKFPPNTYYNAGVVVADRTHQEVFKLPEKLIDHYGDQTYLNQQIIKSNFPVHALSHHWNRMANTNIIGEDPYISHFIHFAGQYSPMLPITIRETAQTWESANWMGKRSIVVVCNNGMGNQIATIPVIEYLAEIHPEYEIYIQTIFTEVFEHLKNEQIKVVKPGETTPKYAIWRSTAQFGAMTDVCSHPTDFHSISLIKRQLPMEKRRIRFKEKPCGVVLPKNTIVIHAGKSGWKSKDAPREFWFDIILGLQNVGFPVAMIGQRDWSTIKEGYGAHYFEQADFNLTNLPLAETADVIRQGWFLLSNDSMPVHLAGAYDNHIGLITIAKRPELILPYRPNDNKTISWTGKPLWEVTKEPVILVPGSGFSWSNWHEGMAFPNPKEIIENIWRIAQLVEQFPVKEKVAGSYPAPPAMLL